ncbi:MAG: glutamyl-tRNA reductase [Candidatus Krumholzibacteria bacterium]|nr:glutamyl-tRNA reductase [Candidatus Krumholzibacteria bacterium]
MSMIAVGMNHRTAPVDVREQFSLSGCGLAMALEELRKVMNENETDDGVAIREGLILSTCNRFEIYAVAKERKHGWQVLRQYMQRLQGLPLDQVRPYLYQLEGPEALEHLMRVAAGLDSMVLGEPQILGQVGEAIMEARNAGTVGVALSEVAKRVLRVGKRARTETAIGKFTTSVSHAAVKLAQDRLGDLSQAYIVLIGAGEMATIAGRSFRERGATHMFVVNRTYSRSVQLAESIGARPQNWYHLPEALVRADLVVTTTNAPHTVIFAKDVAEILPKREGRPLWFIDIALPRDVDPAVANMDYVTVNDIDDLRVVVDSSREQRQAAIPQIEQIISEELRHYYDWNQSRDVVPVVVDLRRRMQVLIEKETEVALRRVVTPEDKAIVSQLAHRILHKILHEPTTRLKASVANGNGLAYADAIRELFALDDDRKEPDQ